MSSSDIPDKINSEEQLDELLSRPTDYVIETFKRIYRDAYGAEVTINAGGRRRTVWVNPSQGYLCSNDPRAHFGLGSTTRADDINVVWPDGSEEQFGGVAGDQIITLRKGSGQRVASAVTPNGGQ